MESDPHRASLAWPPLWSPTHLFLASSHHLWVPPHMETYLPPVPQLPLQQTIQGERDDVVQVLNLEKAETPTPHLV